MHTLCNLPFNTSTMVNPDMIQDQFRYKPDPILDPFLCKVDTDLTAFIYKPDPFQSDKLDPQQNAFIHKDPDFERIKRCHQGAVVFTVPSSTPPVEIKETPCSLD